jgi:hypothetical protein
VCDDDEMDITVNEIMNGQAVGDQKKGERKGHTTEEFVPLACRRRLAPGESTPRAATSDDQHARLGVA